MIRRTRDRLKLNKIQARTLLVGLESCRFLYN